MTSDTEIARFSRWADTYDRSILQRLVFAPLQHAVVERAARELGSACRILDAGCGTGQLLRRLAQRFPDAVLTGVDPAADMVRRARQAVSDGVPVTFAEARAEHLPFGDASFDLVTTTMSFHHWGDQPVALREIARVLAPSGVFLLADALPAGWLRWAFARRGHGRFNPPASLKEMIDEAGLSFVEFAPVARFGGSIQIAVCRAVSNEGFS